MVLEGMSFDANVVDNVWRLVGNNWYSVLINENAYGFFHSPRGVKQGDLSSPALFILIPEILSRSLNALICNEIYKGFGLPK